MKTNRRALLSIVWIILGIGLIAAGFFEFVDSFWSGMGGAFIFVGILQLIRFIRYSKNDEYREKVDTEVNDERNRYITGKAWGWAGYLFVLISAVGCIIFRILGKNELSLLASGALCLLLVLYWVSYFILKRKY